MTSELEKALYMPACCRSASRSADACDVMISVARLLAQQISTLREDAHHGCHCRLQHTKPVYLGRRLVSITLLSLSKFVEHQTNSVAGVQRPGCKVAPADCVARSHCSLGGSSLADGDAASASCSGASERRSGKGMPAHTHQWILLT